MVLINTNIYLHVDIYKEELKFKDKFKIKSILWIIY